MAKAISNRHVSDWEIYEGKRSTSSSHNENHFNLFRLGFQEEKKCQLFIECLHVSINYFKQQLNRLGRQLSKQIN
jgi:hypothetical protein